jgi:hypothetical protein
MDYIVMAITVLAVTALAFSPNKTAREQNLVPLLDACESMVTTICTDKTGQYRTHRVLFLIFASSWCTSPVSIHILLLTLLSACHFVIPLYRMYFDCQEDDAPLVRVWIIHPFRWATA